MHFGDVGVVGGGLYEGSMSSREMDAQGTEAEEERAVEAWRQMPVGGVRRHAGRASYNEAQLVSSCPIRKPLLHGESPPPELLLVPAHSISAPSLRDP